MKNSSRRPCTGVRIGGCLLTIAGALLASQARASNSCPWINEATASGLLGGAADGVYDMEKGQPPACTFTERSGKLIRTLQVSVETARDSQSRLSSMLKTTCGSKASVPLRGIGNEAMSCEYDSHAIKSGRRVLGRVRDQIFVVTLGSSVKNDPVLTPDMLKIKIETAAAQISGGLF